MNTFCCYLVDELFILNIAGFILNIEHHDFLYGELVLTIAPPLVGYIEIRYNKITLEDDQCFHYNVLFVSQ